MDFHYEPPISKKVVLSKFEGKEKKKRELIFNIF
jgi:hypothetical protein